MTYNDYYMTGNAIFTTTGTGAGLGFVEAYQSKMKNIQTPSLEPVLRNIQSGAPLESLPLLDLLWLHDLATTLIGQCELFGITPPEWLPGRVKEIKSAVRARAQVEKEARIREIQSDLKQLRTNEQKVKDLQAELAKLEG